MAADGSLRFDTKIDTSDFDESISTLDKALNKLTDAIEKLSGRIAHGFGEAGTAVREASGEIEETGAQAAESAEKVEMIGTAAKEAEQQVKSLEEQMAAITVETGQNSPSVPGEAQKPKIAMVDASAMQYDPQAMAAVFGDAAAEIYSYTDAVSEFGAQAGMELNQMEQGAEAAGSAAREAASDVAGAAQEAEPACVGWKESVVLAFRAMPDAIKAVMGQIPGIVKSAVSGVPGTVKAAFSKASSAAMAFAKVLAYPVTSSAKKAALGIRGLMSPSNKAAKSILKLSSMFKLMLIRMAMRAVIQGVRDGMKNLVQYSEEVNRSISALTNGTTFLKNSFAAAFAPILSVVAPVLNTLIDLLARAVGYINMFFSALGGKTTFIRAKKINDDYAKSIKAAGGAAKEAGKDAKKALAPFDELTVLQEQASSGSGGGGGSAATPPTDMFETVDIDGSVSGFAEQVRAAFEASDWKTLGTLIGEKFNEAVDSIDWSGAGHKIGSGINGAVQTAYYALSAANFVNLGSRVAELLNGALSEIDFTFVGHLLVRGFTVGLDFLIGLLGTLDWGLVGRSVGDFMRGAFDESYDWITGIDWSQMADSLYENIKEFLTGVDFASLSESFFSALGAALGGAVSFIASFVGDIWDDITGYFADYLVNDDGTKKVGTDWIGGILQGILDAVINIGSWIYEHVCLPLLNGFKDALGINSPSTVMAEQGGFLIEGLMQGIADFLPKLLEKMGEVVEGMKKKLLEIIDYVKGAFTQGWETAWGGVKNIFRGVFNGIISILESALNFIVRGINKLNFDVPEWVPGIGGSSLGFNIQPVHLPRLASGTVVPPRAGEFAAILGDNKRETEVVSPLSTMKQALKEALLEAGGTGSGGDIHLTVNLDGKTVYDEVVRRNRAETKRLAGRNPLLA